jgi:hypothetical protein
MNDSARSIQMWPCALYLTKVTSLSAALSALTVASDQRIGQVSSWVPWCTSTGLVIRSKYGRGEAERQDSADLSGSPYVRAIRRLGSIDLLPVVSCQRAHRCVRSRRHQPTVKAVKSSKLRFLEVVGFPRHALAREIGVGVDVAMVEHQNRKRSIAIWEVHHTGDLEPVTPVGDQVALVRAIVG